MKTEIIKALYIEDDAGLAFLLSDSLVGDSISITHAPDGETGIALFNESNFDVILVDHEMPGLSGIDVIQRMQFEDNPPPIIMVTGAGNERVAVRAMQVGASDYVVKDVAMSYLDILPAVVHQVIDQRRLKEEHAAARKALETERLKTQLIRDFIESASHEFRTPISVIQTACHLLGRIDDPEKKRVYLNRIIDRTKGINNLVDDLVMLMKLDARYDLTLQSMRLSYILEPVIDTLRDNYDARGIEIILDHAYPALKVFGDIDLLKRAFHEVIDNACRYSPDGATVHVIVGEDLQRATVTVEDQGIGIAEDNLDKIFERFYRVYAAHSTRGFGLGLPVAARILDLTKGEITIESQLEQGTTVTIDLPTHIMQLI